MGVDIVLFPLKIEGVAKSFGAGKSTPMRILAGAIQPDRGRLLANGKL
nr:hypothetical protein RTCK_03983 [Rhizobium sp. TCK]